VVLLCFLVLIDYAIYDYQRTHSHRYKTILHILRRDNPELFKTYFG
jgi:hypothetical protein